MGIIFYKIKERKRRGTGSEILRFSNKYEKQGHILGKQILR